MPIRALMVDVDGVVIRHPAGRHWRQGLEADLGIDPAVLDAEFFRPHFAEIAVGHDDLRVRLDEVLQRIAPRVGSDTLIRYWFAEDAAVDDRLLGDLDALRRTGLALHLATTQEALRADHLWRVMGLSDHFDAIHASHEIGAAKPSAAYFAAVERRSGFARGQLLLIDDAESNVEAARRAGWRAHLWTAESTVADLPLS